MAADTALARSLETLLQAEQPFSKVATVEYTHDDYIDDVSTTRIRITPVLVDHNRLSRENWTSTATIKLIFEGSQQVNTTTEKPGTQEDIDDWLTFVDEVIALVRSLKPNGKRASSIFFESRYDRERLRQSNIFLTTAFVAYPLGE